MRRSDVEFRKSSVATVRGSEVWRESEVWRALGRYYNSPGDC